MKLSGKILSLPTDLTIRQFTLLELLLPLLLLLLPHNKSIELFIRYDYLASGHINSSLCLCIFIIMDFIAVNNSWDKYKMSWSGKYRTAIRQRSDAMAASKRYSAIVRGQLFSFSKNVSAAVAAAFVAMCTLSLASFTSNEMLNFVFRFSFNHNFCTVPDLFVDVCAMHAAVLACLVGCDFHHFTHSTHISVFTTAQNCRCKNI